MVKKRTDAEVLQLLARARAQGVRKLELHANGTVLAELDPMPPLPEPPPKGLSAEEKAKKESREYEEHMLHSAEG